MCNLHVNLNSLFSSLYKSLTLLVFVGVPSNNEAYLLNRKIYFSNGESYRNIYIVWDIKLYKKIFFDEDIRIIVIFDSDYEF